VPFGSLCKNRASKNCYARIVPDVITCKNRATLSNIFEPLETLMAASAVVFDEPYSTEEKSFEDEVQEWIDAGLIDEETNVEVD